MIKTAIQSPTARYISEIESSVCRKVSRFPNLSYPFFFTTELCMYPRKGALHANGSSNLLFLSAVVYRSQWQDQLYSSKYPFTNSHQDPFFWNAHKTKNLDTWNFAVSMFSRKQLANHCDQKTIESPENSEGPGPWPCHSKALSSSNLAVNFEIHARVFSSAAWRTKVTKVTSFHRGSSLKFERTYNSCFTVTACYSMSMSRLGWYAMVWQAIRDSRQWRT